MDFKAICARCGAGINNVYSFRGNTYGVECILHMVENQELINHIRLLKIKRVSNFDVSAYLEQQEARAKQDEQNRLAFEDKKEATAKTNAWLIEVLEAKLAEKLIKTVQGVNIYSCDMSFIESMISKLENQDFSETSDKVKEILIEIYAKAHGRYNSKKYNAAYDIAYSKAYPED